VRDQLEKTYSSQRQGLFSLALSITGCRQLAEDAVHTAFERLCRLDTAPQGDFSNYVFASVRNAARDSRRSETRASWARQSVFNGLAVSLPDSESPADDVLTAERDQILRTAVNELDESDREVVVLKIFAGLTFDAVAEILDQPAKTVATRYRRSLMKLEERLRGQL
jgi:RNA polymerase sigma-70 factor, ECF subfamily